MIDNTKEYIICAAIWYDDGIEEDSEEYKNEVHFPMHGKGRTFTNNNIKTGFVIGGFRHGNCISVRPSNPRFNEDQHTVQGFLTSKGRFVDRWQGMYLAWMAGQVNNERALNDKTGGWIPVGSVLEKIIMTDYSIFDLESFMSSIPTDNRFKENQPFNMLYSEDLY